MMEIQLKELIDQIKKDGVEAASSSLERYSLSACIPLTFGKEDLD